MRIALTLEDKFEDVIHKLAEGNEKATELLIDTCRKMGDEAMQFFLDFDDMNIRGDQLVIAFEIFAHNSMLNLLKAAIRRDIEMVNAVNANCKYMDEIAVQEGGSYRYKIELAKD